MLLPLLRQQHMRRTVRGTIMEGETRMEKYKNSMDKIWKISTYISNVFLFAIMVLVVVNVIARRIFNAPIFGVTELVCYGSLASAAFGLAQNEWMDGNVRMTLIFEHVKGRVADIINLIVCLVGFGGFTYVSYFLIMQAINKSASGQVSSELRFSMTIVTGVLAAGFVLVTLSMLAKAVLYAMKLKNTDYSALSEKEEEGKEEEI